MKDYYFILGITKNASISEIKTAYRKLSLKFHPDMNIGDEFFNKRFLEVKEAYEILSDPILRKQYDLRFNAKDKNDTSFNNFTPIIEEFKIDKQLIVPGEEIEITWKVVNADKIFISQIGYISNGIGREKIKIENLSSNKTIDIEIKAENTYIKKQVSSKVTLQNKLYFAPIIEEFKIDKQLIVPGEEIEITWKVVNADKIFISQIGYISNGIGREKIKIENLSSNKTIDIEIKAENTYIKKQVSSKFTLQNKLYLIIEKDLEKKYQKEQIKEESKKNKENTINSFYYLGDFIQKLFLYIGGMVIVLGIVSVFVNECNSSKKEKKVYKPLLEQLETPEQIKGELINRVNNLLLVISNNSSLVNINDLLEYDLNCFFDVYRLERDEVTNLVKESYKYPINDTVNFKANYNTLKWNLTDEKKIYLEVDVDFFFVRKKIVINKKLFIQFNNELKIEKVTDANFSIESIVHKIKIKTNNIVELSDLPFAISFDEFVKNIGGLQYAIFDNFDQNINFKNVSLLCSFDKSINISDNKYNPKYLGKSIKYFLFKYNQENQLFECIDTKNMHQIDEKSILDKINYPEFDLFRLEKRPINNELPLTFFEAVDQFKKLYPEKDSKKK